MSEIPDLSAGSNGGGGEKWDGEMMRLGGMALRNGLLIHGPTHWAVAARNGGGEIERASGPKPSLARGRLGKVPLLRGPLRLAEAMAVIPLVRMRLRSVRLPFEDPGVVAAAGLSMLVSATLRRIGRPTVVREAVVAVLGALPALTALRDPSLAAYHAAEHKAIGAYEQDTDAAEMPKEHQRCGSNLIAPMLATSVAGQLLIERVLDDPGPIARAVVGLAGVGAAVELFVYAERHPGSAIGRAVHGPGHEIQRLVSTREPSDDQLAVGRAALDEILRAESASTPR